MKTQRWIEGLSLCLTAGVAAGAALCRFFPLYIHDFMLGSSLTALLLAGSMLCQYPRGGAKAFPVLFLLGVLCFMTDALAPQRCVEVSWAAAAARQLRTFISGLPFPHGQTAPLLCALLTGDRSGLSRESIAAFRLSGASHLLALSGLHIGIIYTVFSRSLSVLGNGPVARYLRIAVTVPAALFFTVMTGAGPSIVRAFLFISLSELSRLLERKRDPLKIFATALLVQLLVTPSVVTSVGFQLSYAAMLGITLFFPVLRSWWPTDGRKRNPVQAVWETAALSISCQTTTAPIAWMYFHTFPRYFLITNLLAIPLTTGIIVLGIGTIALAAVGSCPVWLLMATDTCATALTRLLELIAML